MGSAVTSIPQTSMVPSVGFDNPSNRRNIVVLPAPFAPTRPTSPRGNLIERSSRAVTPGYRLVRPLMRRSVSESTTSESLARHERSRPRATAICRGHYVEPVVTLDDVAKIALELPEVVEGERHGTRNWS